MSRLCTRRSPFRARHFQLQTSNPLPAPLLLHHHRRLYSSAHSLTPDEITQLLSKPTWSIKSLFDSSTSSSSQSSQSSLQSSPQSSYNPPPPSPPPTSSPESITPSTLHHLLRLSALPPPTSPAQEAKMISDLQSQLRFVQSVQNIDTEGVEPLVALRDETDAGRKEREITVDTMAEELAKEEIVGSARKIRRRKDVPPPKMDQSQPHGWELLSQAPGKRGRYVVVNTRKS